MFPVRRSHCSWCCKESWSISGFIILLWIAGWRRGINEKSRKEPRKKSVTSKVKSRLEMLEDAKSIGATGILIAIAIFAAYKAGQVSGLKEKIHNQQVLDLEILKQK